jgi:hypothetical protein
LPNLPSLNTWISQMLYPYRHIGSFARPLKRWGSNIIVNLSEVAPSGRSEFFGATGPARSFASREVSNADAVSPTPVMPVIWNAAAFRTIAYVVLRSDFKR